MTKAQYFNAIADSLRDHPEQWTIGDYNATHVPSGTELWIANGMVFYETNRVTPDVRMPAIPIAPWRWRIWFALRSLEAEHKKKVSNAQAKRIQEEIGKLTNG